MAFKRSAVRSRLSPPRPTERLVFFFTLRVFQANKQQRFDPAYLHQLQPKGWSFFLYPESLSGKQTTAVRSRLSPPQNTEFLREIRCFSYFPRFLFGLSPAASTIHLPVIQHSAHILHQHGGDGGLSSVVQMRVYIGGHLDIRVSQPFLHILEGEAHRQEHTGAVGSCVKDYAPFLKNPLLLAILPVMGYNHAKE